VLLKRVLDRVSHAHDLIFHSSEPSIRSLADSNRLGEFIEQNCDKEDQAARDQEI